MLSEGLLLVLFLLDTVDHISTPSFNAWQMYYLNCSGLVTLGFHSYLICSCDDSKLAHMRL